MKQHSKKLALPYRKLRAGDSVNIRAVVISDEVGRGIPTEKLLLKVIGEPYNITAERRELSFPAAALSLRLVAGCMAFGWLACLSGAVIAFFFTPG